MWRINWMADPSPRGVANSCGIMVNYRYTYIKIDSNNQIKDIKIIKICDFLRRYFLEDTENNSQNYIEHFVIKAAEDIINLTIQAEKLRTAL